jgi:hypothetical protein
MKQLVIGLLLISLAIAGWLALYASPAPDGLEHTFEKHEIKETQASLSAPMPGYEVPAEVAPTWRKALAGIIGTLVVFGVVMIVGFLLKRLKGKPGASSDG